MVQKVESKLMSGWGPHLSVLLGHQTQTPPPLEDRGSLGSPASQKATQKDVSADKTAQNVYVLRGGGHTRPEWNQVRSLAIWTPLACSLNGKNESRGQHTKWKSTITYFKCAGEFNFLPVCGMHEGVFKQKNNSKHICLQSVMGLMPWCPV